MTANAAPDALERGHAPEALAPWIFSRELDAALLVVPYLVALVAFVASGLSLSGGLPRAYAAWRVSCGNPAAARRSPLSPRGHARIARRVLTKAVWFGIIPRLGCRGQRGGRDASSTRP